MRLIQEKHIYIFIIIIILYIEKAAASEFFIASAAASLGLLLHGAITSAEGDVSRQRDHALPL